MVVDLVLRALLSNLVKPVKLVEVHGVTVWHYEAVKDNSHPPLLAKTRRSNLLRLTQSDGSFGNDDVLVVM